MLRFDDLDFEHLADFTRQIIDAGSVAVIVHARKAVLGGLSPHDNRTVPPLRYDVVQQLRAEFPRTPLIVNGGMRAVPPMVEALLWCDGVMIGREAYHRPWLLAELHQALFPEDRFPRPGVAQVLEVMREYAGKEVAGGARLSAITRHMLGTADGAPWCQGFPAITFSGGAAWIAGGRTLQSRPWVGGIKLRRTLRVGRK